MAEPMNPVAPVTKMFMLRSSRWSRANAELDSSLRSWSTHRLGEVGSSLAKPGPPRTPKHLTHRSPRLIVVVASPKPNICIDVRLPDALPGVAVSCITSEHHLFRAVPSHFGTMLHLAGTSEWTLRGRHHVSRPGTLDLKVPGEVHQENARRGAARLQVVVFDDAIVEEARVTLGRPLGVPEDNAIDQGDRRVWPLVALHQRLMDKNATPAELQHDLCEALAAFVELTSVEARPRSSAWGNSVARAKALLDERYLEKVTLDELAAHARLDKFRLCRAFRAEVGLPPHAYVTHRRITLAQHLLAQGVPQANVAAQVGLYDQSQLHRHFRRIVGVTPGAYARATS